MKTDQAFSSLLSRYGQAVTLTAGGEDPRQGQAFLQPVLERREDWKQVLPTPLGSLRQERFLYLGEPGLPLHEGDTVVWRQMRYEVRTAQPVYVGEVLSHWWAVLSPGEANG